MPDPSAATTPPRRRFRFGLRTLFVLVTVMALAMFVVNIAAPPQERIGIVLWFTWEMVLFAFAVFLGRVVDG